MIIKVVGPDARIFLQGQLTCDVNVLSQNHPIWGAHCDLKGRVHALYQLKQEGDAILLITPNNVAEQAQSHLQHYARFSKVTLTLEPDDKPDPSPEERIFELKAHHVRLHPGTLGKFLPQELGLIERGVVSFEKGCYLGQEIVARLHYLGKLKKQLTYIECDLILEKELEIVDSVYHQGVLHALVLK